ncbi:MAG: polyhydroxyalkanoate synthesis repressor PhaR [Burkholderiales bacterium]|nr:MAG: polyhydroxyalkanoate synthesis repressor PhaR [Burkholderiales bacterium]
MATSRRARAAKTDTTAADGTRILKKYPNRRLYDTHASSYITLADVKKMVLEHQPFEVRDAKSGEDLTRSILLQIILEEETAGMPIFSTDMLSHIIRFYGNAMQGMMGAYLEKNLQTFVELQRRFAENSRGLYDPAKLSPELWTQFVNAQTPFMQSLMSAYTEQSRQLFEQMQEQMRKQSASLFSGIPGFSSDKR